MKLKNIQKSFDKKVVLDGITLEIPEKKITVILGESGCGKTTLLNIISGQIQEFNGEIEFEREYNSFSYIFQEDCLIPWKTVFENIEYVLKDKIPQKDIKKHIFSYLDMVNLRDSAYEYPNVLSGGMRRRVNIARAFSFPSNYLFMDEPFEFLDIKIKKEIIADLKKLQTLEKKTVIFITHDLDSAIELGDQIVVLTKKPTQIKAILKNNLSKNELEKKIKNLFL